MTMRSIWFAGGLLAVSVWTSGSGTAWSQTADAKKESADTGALEEIVVSARRRVESLHDTPVAITAISTSQLESKAAMTIGDLQGAAPNILITQQNSGAAAANLSIRGLTFADIEKSFDPTVAVVVDGVFMGTSTGQYFDFFDISKLEILRGPQGTLFGRNTIGGVINITRSRPTGEWGGKFDISYGRFGTSAIRSVLNVPLVKDVLAAKLFFFKGKTDGFFTSASTGDHVGGNDNKNFGASFLFTPTGSSFNALLTVEKQKQTFQPYNSNIAKTGEVFCLFEPANECNRNTKGDLYTYFGQPAQGTYSSPAETLEMNWDLGSVHFTSVTGYRGSNEDQTQDFDASSSNLYYTRRVQTFHQFSQELRASGKFTDTLDYVAGLYYYNSGYRLAQGTLLFGADAGTQVVSGTAKSTAAFVDFNWQFIDKWRLNFGGRYTEDKKSLENGFVGLPSFGNPRKSFSKFTPKVGIDFRPVEDYMFYASFSRGYRSGGFSNRAQTAISTNTPYEPEIVDSTEVGAKLEFLDHRLAANIALFNAKYKNLQQNTTIPVAGGTENETIVTNVGSAKIRGVELDLIGRASQNLTLNLSLGTLNSHFEGFITEAPVGGVLQTFDYSANDLIYNPKFTLSAGAQYKQPVSFGEVDFNAGYRHIAEYDQQISLGPITVVGGVNVVNGNDPRVRAAAQNLVDASVTALFDTHGTGKWKATVYGRNLTNDLGTSAAFTVAGLWSFASPREPRTYGVTLGYEF
jgi:iron complex outermembrane recepter protein